MQLIHDLNYTSHALNCGDKKLPMVLVFLGVYFALLTFASLAGREGAEVAALFRTPDVHAAMFFALFMLDDPPTSPVHYEDQAAYSAIVAALACLLVLAFGVGYYLPLALLAGNGLVLATLFAFVLLGFEAHLRFFYDASDGDNRTRVSQRWFARHWRNNNVRLRDDVDYPLRRTPGKRRISRSKPPVRPTRASRAAQTMKAPMASP